MPQPDHDRLPAAVNATVDQFLTERERHERTANPVWGLVQLAFLVTVVSVVVYFATRPVPERPAVPYVVVVTPTTYGTPGPTGGPR